ncbi:protein FAM135B-like isoform X3 [Tripterygium wilfordii]|uniref:protein FAM135B-like isoform X3 n=1 Tax=Tripterygium wilfordii TaxID=458696 RepID=UPI0018F843AD|nr:protein FAM135B-like isoform X3 [Tripterygium wilfordii]
MFRRLGWFIGLNYKSGTSKRCDEKLGPARVKPMAMLDTMREIAIYIHRFHNLDLFQQGWYQLKITVRWEDSEYASLGTPARVVQYEGQDIRLSMMISFNLSLGHEGPSASAVILKFELMYAPLMENRSDLQASLDACSAAIHEFRIPPKALLGLHSYCPVYFDAFHSVLVDASVHVSQLKAGPYASSLKVSSDSHDANDVSGGRIDGLCQVTSQVTAVDMKHVLLVKSFLVARDTLLEELQKLSKAVDQTIDLTDFTSKMDDIKLFSSILQMDPATADGGVSGQGKPRNGLEKTNGILDFQSDKLLRTLLLDDLLNIFNTLGDQVSYLWSIFLQFHRANKTRLLQFLRDTWAKDRRTEWSIWMVYSKVEMPHHYISSGAEESSHHGVKRVSTLWKLPDDTAQAAATLAELHRRSIAQMRMNNRSIQDLQIFGDPLRIPIVIVERVMNAPRRTFSENSYLRNLDLIDSPLLNSGPSSDTRNIPSSSSPQPKGRELKIVVFVHGFQGHHLDLRLVRNQWLLIDSKIDFLMSEANEDKTSGDFREMGLRLAEEVVAFIRKKLDKVARSGVVRDIKLSFVGHSIGNVIIRTALAESTMKPYLRYLYTYISISGPHLGYLFSTNSLFNSGLWLLKKLKNTQCIHQLTFTDDPDLYNTFFYKLCKRQRMENLGGATRHFTSIICRMDMTSVYVLLAGPLQKTLENFKHIILLSSPQDGYVPYHSARIELCPAASVDISKKGRVLLEMLNDCLDQIRAPSSDRRVFMRCDVNFDTSSYGKNLNTFIGRAAHIEFLESDVFAKFIMWSFPELFR